MINSFKTIAFFGCSLTSRYREGLCQCFNIAAKKRGMNIVYFNFLGRIGEKNAEFGECELDIIDYVNLDEFDGIIYDGEGFNEISMAEKVINKLRGAKCPVVSISGHVEGFHNIGNKFGFVTIVFCSGHGANCFTVNNNLRTTITSWF